MLTTRRLGWAQEDARLAWAWAWTRVTGGEHLFAPAVMTDPAAPRSQRPGGRERLNYIDLLWPHLAAGTSGQYAELRRLDHHAARLAASIDSSPSSAIHKASGARTT